MKNNSVYNTNENVEYTNLGEDYLKTINLNNNIQYIPELDMDIDIDTNDVTALYQGSENELIKILVDKLSSRERQIVMNMEGFRFIIK